MLIGSEDITKLDRYSEGDPRVLELNGAFNVGNRGMVEFIEVFKNETEYLHTMITATQEKFVPGPGPAWHDLRRHLHRRPLQRGGVAEVQGRPYQRGDPGPYRRGQGALQPAPVGRGEDLPEVPPQSDFHAQVAPHTLEIASMFAILSRLEPTNKCDLMTKLKIYNGEEVLEKGRTKKLDVHELREDTKREGLFGICTRFIMKALDNALSDNTAGNCIHPINVREALINMVKEADYRTTHASSISSSCRTRCTRTIWRCSRRTSPRPSSILQEQAETLFQNYLDHAEAYVNKTKVKDRNTKDEINPDEGFMKSIEEQIAIIGSAADGFRQEVIAYLWAATRRGEKIDYRSYEP